MSTVTLADLLRVSSVPFRRSAVAWTILAEDLDNAYEQFVDGLKLVDRGWASGDAALAAVRKLTAQGHELSNLHNPARQIADALEHHGYAVADLHARAANIVVEFERRGFDVNRTTGAISEPSSLAGDDLVLDKGIHRLFRELAELLGRAQTLDDQTTAVIRSNQPAPGYGFGSDMAGTWRGGSIATWCTNSRVGHPARCRPGGSRSAPSSRNR